MLKFQKMISHVLFPVPGQQKPKCNHSAVVINALKTAQLTIAKRVFNFSLLIMKFLNELKNLQSV